VLSPEPLSYGRFMRFNEAACDNCTDRDIQ
jgi:hypothetical protein